MLLAPVLGLRNPELFLSAGPRGLVFQLENKTGPLNLRIPVGSCSKGLEELFYKVSSGL
jgi:hypothetical protein